MPKTHLRRVKSGEVSQRKLYLDALRIVATVAVVMIHVCSSLVVQYHQTAFANWWWANFFDALSRWAVPVFVMISGAVLLNAPVGKKMETAGQFWQKRVVRLVLPLAFWTAVYAVLYHWWRGDPLSLVFVIRRAFFDQPYEHLYFLYILLELAIITPWLRKVLQQLSPGATAGLVGLCLFITLFWHETRFVLPLFVPYLGYYLLGYFLARTTLSRITTWVVSSVGVVMAGVVSVGTWAAYAGKLPISDPLYFYGYLNLPVMGLSAAVFVFGQTFLSGTKTSAWIKGLIEKLQGLSFGVYLIHPAIIEFLRHMIGIKVESFESSLVGIAVVLVLTLCCSVTVVWAMKKLPLTQKLT